MAAVLAAAPVRQAAPEARPAEGKKQTRRAQRLAAIKVPPVVIHSRSSSSGAATTRTYEKIAELGKVSRGFGRRELELQRRQINRESRSITFPTQTEPCVCDFLESSQGGFARCYQFHCVEKSADLAGKVVAKSSLARERARLKVRHMTRKRVVVPCQCLGIC
jgi:hypothetical protein